MLLCLQPFENLMRRYIDWSSSRIAISKHAIKIFKYAIVISKHAIKISKHAISISKHANACLKMILGNCVSNEGPSLGSLDLFYEYISAVKQPCIMFVYISILFLYIYFYIISMLFLYVALLFYIVVRLSNLSTSHHSRPPFVIAIWKCLCNKCALRSKL